MAKVASTLAARGTLKTLTLTAIDVDDFIASMGNGVGHRQALNPSSDGAG
jgi:hypothetical protein